MIKGHAKIELTNVKTGEVKVVEDDNIVTKAPEIYESMSRLGGHNSLCNLKSFAQQIIFGKDNLYCKENIPLVDAYFGGILLLKDTVDESAYPPAESDTNEMIGNGSVNDAFTETKEYGSFNKQESSYEVKDGTITRKYVYDFGTSKANGVISSVCLCNYQYGFFGCGNGDKSVAPVNKTNYNASADRNRYDHHFEGNTGYGFLSFFDLTYNGEKIISNESNDRKYDREAFYIDFELNKEYLIPRLKKDAFISKDMTSIKIYENNFSRNNVNLMLKDNECTKMLEVEFPEELKTMVSQLGTNYVSWNNVVFNYYNNKLTIVFAMTNNVNNTNNNEYVYVWNINLDLKAMTSSGSELKKIRIASSLNFSSFYAECSTFVIYKKWLYVISSNNNVYLYDSNIKVYKINLENYADIVEINIDVMKEVLPSWSDSDRFYISLFATASNVYISIDDKSDINFSFVIKNDKAKVLNGGIRAIKTSINADGIRANVFSNNALMLSVYNDSGYARANKASMFSPYYGVDVIYNPFMLSTINNLSEPVTKTADMTMKITYTLTGSVVDASSEGS